MIGKPEWFTRRKYGGWGIFPKKWQGWIYILVWVLVIELAQALILDIVTKYVVLCVLVFFLVLDVIDIMVRMKRDERERLHEAISERNALWAIIGVLIVGVGYQVSSSILSGRGEVDYFIIGALLVGVIVKAITNIYLEKRR